jgi:hypothetical protein
MKKLKTSVTYVQKRGFEGLVAVAVNTTAFLNVTVLGLVFRRDILL